MRERGKVYLVGAGPGDPGLLTVRGLKLIGQADVVVYDRLVDRRLLARAKKGADLIYVGKGPEERLMHQEDINALLVAKAQEGKMVVRFKGGDPFVFGRGGEEAEALLQHGIPFEVVPGVTSAIAVPAYAGIPVTDRRYASSFAVITGRESRDRPWPRIAWDKVAQGVDTLVILMVVESLSHIVGELVRHGLSPTTPIALIRWGTEPRQETIDSTLADIVQKVKDADFGPPAVAVVGEVVRLRRSLRWFDNRPLFGKRILVTRAREQASALAELLEERGAEPIELHTIEIHPPEDYAPLDRALSSLSRYRWIVFTSVNGVEAFFGRLWERALDLRELKGVKLCAIGPATAKALEERGLRADYVPQDYTVEGVIAGLEELGVSGAMVLLPRADIAGEALARELSQLGAEVEEVVAYRTVLAPGEDSYPRELLLQGKVDAITFTSSSTVRGLVAILGKEVEALEKPVLACIGPVTAAAASELGLRVDVIAREHTIPGLVKALVEKFGASPKQEGGM